MGQSAKFTPRKLNTLNQNNKALKKLSTGRPVLKIPTVLFRKINLIAPSINKLKYCCPIFKQDLVEVHVAIDVGRLGIHHLDLLHVLGDGRDLAHQRADRGQFGRTEVDAGVDAQAVREVARRGRHRRAALADLRLVAHAQRAARHFHARAGLAEDA
jgi:hypothetical protein